MLITLDIETNTSHDVIWCAVTQNIDTGEMLEHYDSESLAQVLFSATGIVGHNTIGFDAPVLEKQWSLQITTEKLKDTLVLCRLWTTPLELAHSLDDWGNRSG